MGWDGYDFGLFSVLVDSHGGEREKEGEKKLAELRADILNFCQEMERKYNIEGVIKLYN